MAMQRAVNADYGLLFKCRPTLNSSRIHWIQSKDEPLSQIYKHAFGSVVPIWTPPDHLAARASKFDDRTASLAKV